MDQKGERPGLGRELGRPLWSAGHETGTGRGAVDGSAAHVPGRLGGPGEVGVSRIPIWASGTSGGTIN